LKSISIGIYWQWAKVPPKELYNPISNWDQDTFFKLLPKIKSFLETREIDPTGFFLKQEPEEMIIAPQKKLVLTLRVRNFNPHTLRNVKITLSGPAQVDILEDTKVHIAIERKTIRNSVFTIIPRELGVFTLTATLKLENEETQSFSFEVKAE